MFSNNICTKQMNDDFLLCKTLPNLLLVDSTGDISVENLQFQVMEPSNNAPSSITTVRGGSAKGTFHKNDCICLGNMNQSCIQIK
jgi:hypothetical protein